MAYCVNCGVEIVENAKFCQKCGCPTENHSDGATRKQEFASKIFKCPNCGEVLKSFEISCPVCGLELRGTKASSAVKEFALKLEAIESRREYEKPRGLFFSVFEVQQRISKTDEQKISLIKSFSVPNSKEDMLEFMILATSNMNMNIYDSSNTSVSKSEKEINAAWFSKVQQVYEKAKRSYSTDDTFTEIKTLYDSCNNEIKKSKKKGIIKWTLLFGWMPILFVVIFLWIAIYSPIDEKKEVARLDAIVKEIETQLENGEYKYALMNADGLVYSGSIRNDEQSRRWEIKREYWIDKVIEEAADEGVILEYPEEKITEEDTEDKANSSDFAEGFTEGFTEGLQPGLDSAKENINEFNKYLDEVEDMWDQYTDSEPTE